MISISLVRRLTLASEVEESLDDHGARRYSGLTNQTVSLMGCYVNPRSGTKEAWLAAHAVPMTEAEARKHEAGDRLIVVLIDDGSYKVAPIVIDDGARDMLLVEDGRKKRFYLASEIVLSEAGFI